MRVRGTRGSGSMDHGSMPGRRKRDGWKDGRTVIDSQRVEQTYRKRRESKGKQTRNVPCIVVSMSVVEMELWPWMGFFRMLYIQKKQDARFSSGKKREG